MFIEESLWIRQAIHDLPLPDRAKIADVGSSDLFFRTRVQPHIAQNIYFPMERRGFLISSCDSKKDLGVDHQLDLCDQNRTPKEQIGQAFDLVLCANMLEHVEDRQLAIRSLLSLVKINGYLLITVPREYFYHEDPIDTMYRPTPREVVSLLEQQAACEVITESILPITQKQYYIMPVYPTKLLHNLPFFAYRSAWRWLLKPFRWKVTCLLVRIGKKAQD